MLPSGFPSQPVREEQPEDMSDEKTLIMSQASEASNTTETAGPSDDSDVTKSMAIPSDLREKSPPATPPRDEKTVHVSEEQKRGPASSSTSSTSSAASGKQGPTLMGYKLNERLGAGTFGSVWKARHLRTHADVAVKLFDRKIGADWDYLRREIECILNVGKHPNVVTLLDADFFQDPPFYVMELVNTSMDNLIRGYHKEKLASLSKEQRDEVEWIPWPDVAQAIRWFEEAAQGLLYVHGKAFIHCDLKPGNILIDDQDRVRIVDFGQALLTGRDEVSLGTLFFMPPEQTEIEEGKKFHPSVQWDVYGLGATIYTLLAGRPPRSGKAQMRSISTAASMQEKLEVYRVQLASTPLVPLSRINKGVSPEFSAIIDKCLEINPERRYQSISEILEDLSRMKRNQPMFCYQPWSRGYLFKRFIRRHAMWLAPVAGLIAVLCISQYYIYLQYKTQTWAVITQYNPDGTSTTAEVKSSKTLGRALDDAQIELYKGRLDEARRALESGDLAAAQESLGRAKPGGRSWEWHRLSYLAAMYQGEGAPPPGFGVERLRGLPKQNGYIQAAPNGHSVVVNWPYGRADVFDTKNGEIDRSFTLGGKPFRYIALGSDGKTAVAITPGTGEVYVRRRPRFSEWQPLAVHPTAKAAAITPDLERVATIDGSGTIRFWITATGDEIFEIIGGPLDTVAAEFSEAGNKLILYDAEGDATMYQALAR